MSDFARAMELADRIETMEDYPGDIAMVECVIALRDELTALLQLLRDMHNDGDSEFLNKSLRDRIAAAIGDAS